MNAKVGTLSEILHVIRIGAVLALATAGCESVLVTRDVVFSNPQLIFEPPETLGNFGDLEFGMGFGSGPMFKAGSFSVGAGGTTEESWSSMHVDQIHARLGIGLTKKLDLQILQADGIADSSAPAPAGVKIALIPGSNSSQLQRGHKWALLIQNLSMYSNESTHNGSYSASFEKKLAGAGISSIYGYRYDKKRLLYTNIRYENTTGYAEVKNTGNPDHIYRLGQWGASLAIGYEFRFSEKLFLRLESGIKHTAIPYPSIEKTTTAAGFHIGYHFN